MKDIQKIWDMCRAHARKRGFYNDCEDFAQYAVMRITQGRKASVKNLFVDFLRTQYGRVPRDSPGRIAERLQYDSHLERLAAPEIVEKETELRQIYHCMSILKGRHRTMFGMRHLFGMSEKEIAFLIGICEGRVGQIFGQIKNILLHELHPDRINLKPLVVPRGTKDEDE